MIKRISTIAGIALCIFFTSEIAISQQKVIRVAIYDDEGGGGVGPKNIELCLGDSMKYKTQRVKAADIRSGILRNFDVVVQPGGSGSKQAKTLERSGVDSIRQFVRRGGGYLGICAGAYLATAEYEWSLHILNSKVIDRAHWNRGKGDVVIIMNKKGRKFFGTKDKEIKLNYAQGPLMAPAEVDSLPKYRELSTFKTEIALNGAPVGIMVGKTAFAQSEFGKGRVFAMSPHPEKSESLRYLVAQSVNWLAKRE
jgi:hypothetical protein